MQTLNLVGGLLLLAIAANATDWYQRATFYQIFPRSFQDNDGDGIGDLPGIISRIKYLADIGIDAVWLSPPFKSPLRDFGYDASDFYDIHPEYGTLADFDRLVEEAHQNGIKLMLDLNPNHSSDQHDWFRKSIARDPTFYDYYVWRPPREPGGEPPNNWISVMGGSAWTYNADRGEYYLHQFGVNKPDLNYRNPKVLEEMTRVLLFWLDRGVDGFRLGTVNHILEDDEFRDEPLSGWGNPGEYGYLDHIYTRDQRDGYELIYHWREVFDEYSQEQNRTVILMTEAYTTIENTMLYYESADGKQRQGAHMPFNFQLIFDFRKDQNAVGLKRSIDQWMDYMPPRHTPSWMMGSHDHSRVATRMGLDRVDQVMTLLHTLPGTSFTYYGDEIAMQDFRDFLFNDPRDPSRTPMQWNFTTSAGFSTSNTTWLPVHPDFSWFNVNIMQKNLHNPFQHLRRLANLRRHPTICRGEFLHRTIGPDVYALLRELRGDDSFLVVLNLAGAERTVDLRDFVNLPRRMYVEVAQPSSCSRVGTKVDIGKLALGRFDSVVLRAKPAKIESETKPDCVESSGENPNELQ